MKSNKCSTGRSTRQPRETTSYPSDQSDASTEAAFPPVPYDDPAWDDTDRWVLGSWLPEGLVLVPTARNGFAKLMRRAPKSGGRRHGRL
jgi:hypothetical protein